ncbi:MAG: glycerophosphodiester phosphodiesterase family protein [Proteobacteria bacterium]|nr:glycerophosphodiester phosphodiesterase family protein [Pseudomonadota bacterium]
MLENRSFAAGQKVISQRTGGVIAPENSLAGIKHARNLGFQNIHFDVRLTADGIPILLTNESFDPSTGVSGLASEVFFDQINGLDIGSDYGNEYIGEKLPTLYQALSTCTELEIRPVIELKPSSAQERVIAEISVDILKTVNHEKKLFPLFASENTVTLTTLMDIAPDIFRGLIWNNELPQEASRYDKLMCHCVFIPQQLITPQLVDTLHRKKHSVIATNVNDSIEAITVIEHKVDALVTAQIDAIGPYFF